MVRLEELVPGVVLRGILPDEPVTVVATRWYGPDALELTYNDASGRPDRELLYREREPELELASSALPWSFDADGSTFRLASEAYRISLAYLFDPLLAVHTSIVEPLPHQITAVYEEMLPRQPLRFLLADDPGAGKTIMAGLLIKELMVRGDLQRCLICCPGSLVDQWQDELRRRFALPFEIITRESIEASLSGNPYAEKHLVISRLDHMARNESVQAKLQQTDWDLVVVDEAHKMSASFSGGEVHYTKRYSLGQLLSKVTRNFLLMTATPHNGKEEDFQLFMGLIDPDRFEGKFRSGTHRTDVSDLMRRLVKENLLKFDGTRLFPERCAYTVNYDLSDEELELYERVTEYVREEFNRSENLESDSRGTVGFALTILQRRLASSPEAIYQSLGRRRERLQRRVEEERTARRGAVRDATLRSFTLDDLEDLEEAPESEVEETEERVVDQASAARTIAELEAEITTLERLEALALSVRRTGRDRKWEELSGLLQTGEMFDAGGKRRKLIVFTEHRDTLNYLDARIRTLLGRDEAVARIHGGMGREERLRAQEEFRQNEDVQVLLATDAAGEGINLQRANLLVNYDLPWNPNRLEQRFGRIHRIGQTEVCHMWNLVARETREGYVYHRLLEKLEEQRAALGGQVFDVLNKVAFENRPLRDLLVDAVRYGDRPEIRARLAEVVDSAFNREHLIELIEQHALVQDSLDTSEVRRIREDMERAEARRLQPHFIADFFLKAFRLLGGTVREREPGRYEVSHVPAVLRNRMQSGRGSILRSYERITFEKGLIAVQGKPLADFVFPGHPLLDATIALVLDRYRDQLKRGAVLVDPTDGGEEVRALFYLEHALQDARKDQGGNRRVISRRMQFVELDGQGGVRSAGYAPYLDYRPLRDEERSALESLLRESQVGVDLERQALDYAVSRVVPEHLEEVRRYKEELIVKTMREVKTRLTAEIGYWDRRATELKTQELAGRTNARLNSGLARQRANDLEARLARRMEDLEQERRISPLPPVLIGGALVVPAGLLARLTGTTLPEPEGARDTREVERLAMEAVMNAERALGYEPRDVSADKVGYDVESRVPETGLLRFIEVKGRVAGADTVTVTKNEILTGLNKPDEFILAIVEVDGQAGEPRYVRSPFRNPPDFEVTRVNYKLRELLARSTQPS